MTATSPMQPTDHIVQICRERSERGVATRADWQRLAELNPDRAYNELKNYLQVQDSGTQINPYEQPTQRRFAGAAVGFVVGVIFMAGYWLFGEYLHENVVTSSRGWDLVTFSQYVAASLLPAFAWLGWWIENKRQKSDDDNVGNPASLKNASWDDLLARFDATRRAGGTRMY